MISKLRKYLRGDFIFAFVFAIIWNYKMWKEIGGEGVDHLTVDLF